MRARIIITIIVVAAFGAGTIQAQPIAAPPQPPTPERQAGLFAESASVALKSEDFDTAIDMFTKAYKAVPLPVYLFDIAQANRKKAEALHTNDPMKAAEFRDAAREYYRQFLDTQPDDEDLELKARGLKARLDDLWAAEHPKEEAMRLREEERRHEVMVRAEQARLAEERRKQREHEDKIREAVQRTVAENSQSKARIFELSGGAAISAGLICGSIGAYLGLKARHLSDDLTRQDVFDRSRISQGNQDEREMVIAYVAGGVLIAGGAAIFWFGHQLKERAAAKSAVSVTAVPALRGGTLVVLGSF